MARWDVWGGARWRGGKGDVWVGGQMERCGEEGCVGVEAGWGGWEKKCV